MDEPPWCSESDVSSATNTSTVGKWEKWRERRAVVQMENEDLAPAEGEGEGGRRTTREPKYFSFFKPRRKSGSLSYFGSSSGGHQTSSREGFIEEIPEIDDEETPTNFLKTFSVFRRRRRRGKSNVRYSHGSNERRKVPSSHLGVRVMDDGSRRPDESGRSGALRGRLNTVSGQIECKLFTEKLI